MRTSRWLPVLVLCLVIAAMAWIPLEVILGNRIDPCSDPRWRDLPCDVAGT